MNCSDFMIYLQLILFDEPPQAIMFSYLMYLSVKSDDWLLSLLTTVGKIWYVTTQSCWFVSFVNVIWLYFMPADLCTTSGVQAGSVWTEAECWWDVLLCHTPGMCWMQQEAVILQSGPALSAGDWSLWREAWRGEFFLPGIWNYSFGVLLCAWT